MKKIHLLIFLCQCVGISAFANVGIFIQSGWFKDIDDVSLFPSDGLMQLINLGEDGVLNPVLEGAWVSSDDVLIDLPFGSAEFSSSGGFDTGELDTGLDGEISRFFDFPIVPGILEEGDFLALRWWPQYTAAEFHEATPLMPQLGDKFGQARIDVPVLDPISNTAWVVPAESTPLAVFDPLISPDLAATLPGLPATAGFTGQADQEVIPIPEPAHVASLLGLVFLALTIYHRRSRHRRK